MVKPTRYNAGALRRMAIRGSRVIAAAARATSTYNQFRSGGSYTQQRGGRSTEPGIVSNQFQTKQWYKKKRMPRRKRKQWVKFTKKVRAVFNKEMSCQTILRREVGTASAAINTQNFFNAMLFPADGVVASMNDLVEIKKSLAGTAAVGDKSKFRIESGVLDLAIQAKATNTNTLYADVYSIVARKDLPSSMYTSPTNMFANLTSESTVDLEGDTRIAPTDIGSTPFSMPLFCQYWKILSKKTITMTPGQVAEMQLRDSKNKYFMGKVVEDKTSIKGWTQGFFIIIRSQYNGTETPSCALDFGYTKHYVCRNIDNGSNVTISAST